MRPLESSPEWQVARRVLDAYMVTGPLEELSARSASVAAHRPEGADRVFRSLRVAGYRALGLYAVPSGCRRQVGIDGDRPFLATSICALHPKVHERWPVHTLEVLDLPDGSSSHI